MPDSRLSICPRECFGPAPFHVSPPPPLVLISSLALMPGPCLPAEPSGTQPPASWVTRPQMPSGGMEQLTRAPLPGRSEISPPQKLKFHLHERAAGCPQPSSCISSEQKVHLMRNRRAKVAGACCLELMLHISHIKQLFRTKPTAFHGLLGYLLDPARAVPLPQQPRHGWVIVSLPCGVPSWAAAPCLSSLLSPAQSWKAAVTTCLPHAVTTQLWKLP